MKKYLLLCGAGLLLLLGACQEKKTETFVVNLNEAQGNEKVKTSDFIENIRCIPLETNEDFLIPDDQTRIYASGKYIITISNNAVHQFSPDGKYIRKLANAGKGPDEYNMIFGYTVDEDNDLLYYSHYGDWENISVINLKNGQPAGKLKTRSLPWSMRIINGNILCFPMSHNNHSGADIFMLSPTGILLDSLKSLPPKGGVISLSNYSLIPGCENDIFIYRNDSVYLFDFQKSKLLATLQYDNKFDAETNPVGVEWEFILKTPDCFLIQKKNTEMKRNGNAISVRSQSNDVVRIDAKDFHTSKIEKLYIDPLDIEYSNFPYFRVTGKKLVAKMSAFTLKEIIQEKREEGKSLTPELEQLDQQITEESNPVIILGDLK